MGRHRSYPATCTSSAPCMDRTKAHLIPPGEVGTSPLPLPKAPLPPPCTVTLPNAHSPHMLMVTSSSSAMSRSARRCRRYVGATVTAVTWPCQLGPSPSALPNTAPRVGGRGRQEGQNKPQVAGVWCMEPVAVPVPQHQSCTHCIPCSGCLAPRPYGSTLASAPGSPDRS
jgi:hypothetical protein